MKKILLAIFKFFLLMSALALVVLLVFAVTMVFNWPIWVGIFASVGLIGLALGFIFLKKIWNRHREQRFVQQVIEQDEYYVNTLVGQEKELSQEVQHRWKEAMGALRKSHLKKEGNPLYVLPWYMIIGESGSGKTTAIESADLSSPFAEVTRTSGLSGTRNCDWWFFDNAIIIDTAGRYAIPVDDGRDKEEWQNFLTQLVKFRKKEPLNGLVITIAADKLLESGPEALEAIGKSIRLRFDELMRGLMAKFPIYILVTKCDQIQGMTQFCELLPEEKLRHAMGFLNQNMSTDVVSFTQRAINTIEDRLREIRLLLFQRAGTGDIDPGILIFPEEFSRMKPGLEAFMKGAFLETKFKETPMLRGVFFSSGKQEGSPFSHFLQSMGLIEEKEVLPNTNKGIFLSHLFSRILPRDRQLFAPTLQGLEWQRLTKNLGLTAWTALILAFCGLLSFSFYKNMSTLNEVRHEFKTPPILTSEVVTNVNLLNKYREAILKVEEKNENWWIPRFWLDESLKVEKNLKQKYCQLIQAGFMEKYDTGLVERMSGFTDSTPDELVGKSIVFLVKRINLMQARLEGQELEDLKKKPQPSYESIVIGANKKILPQVREQFRDLYLYSLVWRNRDDISLNMKVKEFRELLKASVETQQNLNWITAWVNEQPGYKVTLEEFWTGTLASPKEKDILPAFTLKGKEQIDTFFAEMKLALSAPIILERQQTEFKDWYKDSYIRAWYNFGYYFPNGKKRLKGLEEWSQLAQAMGSEKGPYFRLLDMMTVELEPFSNYEDLPGWINHIYDLSEFRAEAENFDKKKEKKGGMTKVLQKISSKAARVVRMGRQVKKTKKSDENLMLAAKAFYDYQSALESIAPISASKEESFKQASKTFREDKVTSDAQFFIGLRSANLLKKTMADPKLDNMFEDLLYGPLNFLWDIVRYQTACYLQKLWERKVLFAIADISDSEKLTRLLFDDKTGYVVNFIESNKLARPFISRSYKRKGYAGKRVMGDKIPFKKRFYKFLNEGNSARKIIKEMAVKEEPEPEEKPEPEVKEPVQTDFVVTIKGLPTDVNSGARMRPQLTRLEVQCSGSILSITNHNFPVRKVFEWSSQSCGDVVFRIEVGSRVLTKRYSGNKAFPKFLKDFSRGNKKFYAHDFPAEETALNRMGIQWIEVKYNFNGHRPVIKLLKPPPPKPKKKVNRKKEKLKSVPIIPEKIVTCWDW